MGQGSGASKAASNQSISRIQEAIQLLGNGRRSEAAMLYEAVAQDAADDFAVNFQLGHLCCELGAVERAIAHYETALKERPGDAHCLMHLASAYEMGGQSDVALRHFTESLAINDELADAHSGLSAILMRLGRFKDAIVHLERAHGLRPSDGTVLTNLALTLMRLDRHEAAQAYAEKAVKATGGDPDALFALVQILTESGQVDEAIRHCERIIRKRKTYGPAYDFLARLKKFSKADRSFIDKTEKVLKGSMDADQRGAIHYALGKMYDDCGEWDKAIEHYDRANLLDKGDFDTKKETRYFKKILKTFNAAVIEQCRVFGHDSDQAVFIVGMPRSGTTLMEQMIASHPGGAAAGEMPDMPRIAREMVPEGTSLRSASRANLNEQAIRQHAAEYLDALRQGRDHADRIVDKLPGNFLYLGLIAMLFPNATILHAVRHPLDVCLSCYFQNFAVNPWATDFTTISYAYRKYREAMTHWKRVLPDGWITDISYERLVENPEGEGRRMLEACGLSWDSSILEFHGRQRTVKTASVGQVRQPIYRTSSQRWNNYAAHIGELAAGLSDYLQQDREALKAAGIDIGKSAGPGWFGRLTG